MRSQSRFAVFLTSISESFLRTEVASGNVLLVVTVATLLVANTSLSAEFEAFWAAHREIAGLQFGFSLRELVNDGLMTLFFLAVGMEIKHEVTYGRLASAKQSLLPIFAAIGGMVVPALIYLAFNRGETASSGWGIPVATDIAFSLGVLALIGNRLPSGVRVFVAALAIADDVGAVLVIALFYSHSLVVPALLTIVVLVGLLLLLRRWKVEGLFWYLLIGVLLWAAFMWSGIHPTLAGVILAAVLPTSDGQENHSNLEQFTARLESMVAFGIIPLFVLANAGLDIRSMEFGKLGMPVFFGVSLGLLIGKPVGILAASWIAVRLFGAQLPNEVQARHLVGGAILCGIGFTMSLFIAGIGLAGGGSDYQSAKLAILVSGLAAGGLGYLALRVSIRERV